MNDMGLMLISEIIFFIENNFMVEICVMSEELVIRDFIFIIEYDNDF